jgi:hypothetical protein
MKNQITNTIYTKDIAQNKVSVSNGIKINITKPKIQTIFCPLIPKVTASDFVFTFKTKQRNVYTKK